MILNLITDLGGINRETVYDVCIVSAATIAIGLVPAMVAVYRHVLISRRLDDLRSNLWDPDAIRRYITIFTPEDEDKCRTKGDLDRLVERTFMQVHGWGQYFPPMILLTFLVGVVIATCTMWADAKLHSQLDGTIVAIPEPLILALAGSYVWSIYEILNRIRSRDLTPDDLVDMSLRQIAAIPIGYTFSQFAIGHAESAFAFAAAAFPLRDVRLLFRQRLLKKMDQTLSIEDSRATAGYLGRIIDGLGSDTLARLQELQVVTYMDLAYADPVRIMARTGYSIRHVLAWIDQALLAVYTLPMKDKFITIGLPCALDACEFYEDHCFDKKTRADRDWKNDLAVSELAKTLGISVVFVPEILKRVWEDPHVQFLGAIWYSQEDSTPQSQSGQEPPVKA